MQSMFYNDSASAFDQDLGGWDVRALSAANAMFAGATLSTANYDALLVGWNAQPLYTRLQFHGGNSQYCLGAAARTHMMTAPGSGGYGWTITDGGQGCEVQCGGAATYTFSTQDGVVIDVTSAGTNLACLAVQKVSGDHPQATPSLQTGRYWTIHGLQSDATTTATADYAVNLTLPHTMTLDTAANVCKYLGIAGWDCARTSSTPTTVTRNGIAALSDWAVGAHFRQVRQLGRPDYLELRPCAGARRTGHHWNLPADLVGGKHLYHNQRLTGEGGPAVCLLVEGQADGVALGQLGIAATALCGLHGDADLRQLGIIHVALDNDAAGQARAVDLALQLDPLCKVVVWPSAHNLPDGKRGAVKDAADLVRSGATVETLAARAHKARGEERKQLLRRFFDLPARAAAFAAGQQTPPTPASQPEFLPVADDDANAGPGLGDLQERSLPAWLVAESEPLSSVPALPVSQREGYDSDEWYTPAWILAAARAVLGQIDLDPASCAMAQAASYWTRSDDGHAAGMAWPCVAQSALLSAG